jgi:hypothetical protein
MNRTSFVVFGVALACAPSSFISCTRRSFRAWVSTLAIGVTYPKKPKSIVGVDLIGKKGYAETWYGE